MSEITINVLYKVVLHGAGSNDFDENNPLRGPLEGVGPEIETFFIFGP